MCYIDLAHWDSYTLIERGDVGLIDLWDAEVLVCSFPITFTIQDIKKVITLLNVAYYKGVQTGETNKRREISFALGLGASIKEITGEN